MSEFGKLNWKDIGKGFLVAAGTVVVTGLANSLQSGALPTLNELGVLAVAGLGAGLTYVLKNVFTNSENKLGQAEGK